MNSRKFETIRQLAKRPMMDKHHTTTDEEIKNAVGLLQHSSDSNANLSDESC